MNGLRGIQDGISYFGFGASNDDMSFSILSKTSEIINDVLIGFKETNLRIFKIFFSIEKQKFFLKCIKDKTFNNRSSIYNFGLFTKLDSPMLLRKNKIINFGNTCLILEISYNHEDGKKIAHSAKPGKYKSPQFEMKNKHPLKRSLNTCGDTPKKICLFLTVYSENIYKRKL